MAKMVSNYHLEQQHWALLPFVFGIIIGLSLSTIILIRPSNVVTKVHIDIFSFKEGAVKETQRIKLPRHQDLLVMSEIHAGGYFETETGRPRLLSDVAAMKEAVYYAVIMTDGQSSEMVETLNITWARDIPKARVSYHVPPSLSLKRGEEKLSHSMEMNNVVEVHPTQELREIQVLAYLCEHKINLTKWYYIGYDSAYVRTDELESYLHTLEAIQDQSPYLGKPIKRDSGRVCLPATGTILSYLALTQLCPKLTYCMHGHLDPEYALGECIQKQLPNIQCNKEGHPQNLFLKFDGSKKGPIIDPKNWRALDQALTVYPVVDPKLMYNIHHYVLSRRLNQSQLSVQELKQSMDTMESFLPQLSLKSDNGGEIMSVEDTPSWHLINKNVLMSRDYYSPALQVHPVWKREIDMLVKRSMNYLHSLREAEKVLVFSRIVNAYWRLLPLKGMDYIIDFEAKEEVTSQFHRFRVSLSRSFVPVEISPVQPQVKESKKVAIVLVMSSEHEELFKDFMKQLSQVLDRDERVELIVVTMKSKQQERGNKLDSRLDSIIHPYEARYLRASFKVLHSPYLLSRSHGLSLALRELRPNDVLFLADIYMEFDAAFLERCRHLPLQGQQVYYPILFAMTGGNVSKTDGAVGVSGHVSSELGHWLMDSYKSSCIYAADVLASIQKAGSKGIPKEVDTGSLYNGLRERGYEIVRSTESGLWRKHSEEGSCLLDFVGDKEVKPDKESYEVLRVKTQLSELLFDHEGKHSHNKF